MTPRVREVLSWYGANNVGTLTNLARLLNHGRRRIPIATPVERVRHIVDCAFAGRRIVIFSGGAAVFDDDKLLAEIRAIHAGGGFGSFRGHNSFQRPKEGALRMLGAVMNSYTRAPDRDQSH
jgi:DhnA family fructose-bisphosphate aldolase class Ia